MAPEVLSKSKYSEKADIFSFGIVLWEIFTGERPYDTVEYRSMNQAQLMYQIVDKEARPSLEGLDSGLQQLIRDCWDLEPRIRPSFSEIVVRLRRMKKSFNTGELSDFEGKGSLQNFEFNDSESDYYNSEISFHYNSIN